MLKQLFKYFILVTLPSVFIYAGSANNITNILVEKKIVDIKNVNQYQLWAFFIGTVLALIISSYYYQDEVKTKKRLEAYKKQNKLHIRLILEKLCEELKIRNDINVRVFKVQKRWFSDETQIVHFNVDSVTNALSSKNSLIFKHVKNNSGNVVEGVVGMCYDHKSFAADYNALNSHRYVLTDEQKITVGKVIFCCAAPILRNNKIKYIIALDSKTIKIKINNTSPQVRVDDILENYLERISTTFDEFIL